MPAPSKRIHIRIQSNQQQKPTNETLLIPLAATDDDIRDLILTAADVPLAVSADVVVKVRRPDGTLVGLGSLEERGSGDGERYLVEVKDDTTAYHEPIARTLSQLTATTSPDELASLRAAINELKNQLEEIDKTGISRVALPRTPKKAVRRVSKIDPRYLAQPKYIFTDETRNYLKGPSFDNWQWEENEMLALLEFMMTELSLVEEFKLELGLLKRFLQSVKDGYNMNMYGILHTTGVVAKLKPLDKLILIFSAIGHDLDHPVAGSVLDKKATITPIKSMVSPQHSRPLCLPSPLNISRATARTDLAIIYNDIAPLENHHCAVLFTLIRETGVLANLPDPIYREFRKGVIRCILATDMARHGDLMSGFKKCLDAPGGFNFEDGEHKSMLLQMIMKCADISNEVRPTDVAEPWVDCLLEEFFTQSDLEKAQGLPYAPFMDREKVTKANAQVGFIAFVMVPLFELVSKVLPNMEEPIMKPIQQALAYYKDLQEKEKQEKAEQERKAKEGGGEVQAVAVKA
ncbi:High affinity cAMP-specific and IBMX-insensitive 3',5'-cyclic phosphodiesterase 9A [Rhizophlyctis rosea]|uniref:High affinity cAMP-specific and IBMX-insensitive 3',5'-cyclic phosphodiesterase 9A n=1 Tax=Rhizophlyctis rosea TaxID=64517 RepID=A0AAD5X781_9FUNG|nr:High affinity cAMP-specific and IBMX-insensitive 3',5'-cyclic phosphodiesterase 9A [Rhizophlyctis rosea]